MCHFVFIEDYLIAKSEIVSALCNFVETCTFPCEQKFENPTNEPIGEMSILFLLKNGTNTIFTKKVPKSKYIELKNSFLNQMKDRQNNFVQSFDSGQSCGYDRSVQR